MMNRPPRTQSIRVYFTAREAVRVHAAADVKERPLSQWAREVLLARAGEVEASVYSSKSRGGPEDLESDAGQVYDPVLEDERGRERDA